MRVAQELPSEGQILGENNKKKKGGKEKKTRFGDPYRDGKDLLQLPGWGEGLEGSG